MRDAISYLTPRARTLAQNTEGGVTGVVVEIDGQQQLIEAERAVILATGGFEWNRNLLGTHFPGPTDRLGSPNSNKGGGHAMASTPGAQLARMDQATGCRLAKPVSEA